MLFTQSQLRVTVDAGHIAQDRVRWAAPTTSGSPLSLSYSPNSGVGVLSQFRSWCALPIQELVWQEGLTVATVTTTVHDDLVRPIHS
jgi:hypothetical protein